MLCFPLTPLGYALQLPKDPLANLQIVMLNLVISLITQPLVMVA